MNITKLRIIIFEDDTALANLLKLALSNEGHHVLTFTDPTLCPIFKKRECECPQEFPCADIVISDISMPHMTGIDFFKLQRKRGCKALDENKALMSATHGKDYSDEIKQLGCHYFKKPFKLTEIIQWVNECAMRIPEDRTLAALG